MKTLLAIAILAIQTAAADGTEPDMELSLDDILNLKMTVASKKELTSRESPGVVSLVTAEEIASSGARDLIDVLNLVPGFFFGADAVGVVGLSIRGNWAHEGKVLLLVDGQQMNEIVYSNIAFGNHFPVDQIQRIEIIRGPGSALYGGYAELAVINIVTKGADELNGFAGSAVYGQMERTYGRRNLGLSYGKKSGDLSFSAAVFAGQGNRSDRDYRDSKGNSVNLAENSRLDPRWLNLGLKYKNLEARFIADKYHTTDQTSFGINASELAENDFTSYLLGIRYEHPVTEGLKLMPSFNFSWQDPWRYHSARDPSTGVDGHEHHTIARRVTLGFLASYDWGSDFNLIGGLEAYRDDAINLLPGAVFSNGSNHVEYYNKALISQALVKTPAGLLTAGARYDSNNGYGSAFVPRLALTKVFDEFHLKGLYSKAFRAPAIEHVNRSIGIKPERTTVYEVEAGYRLSRSMYLTTNLFDIAIQDPIVYFPGAPPYRNFSHTGTRGLEIEYRLQDSWGSTTASYSFYRASQDVLKAYEVPEDTGLLLGAPAHKATLGGSVRLFSTRFRVNPSLIYYSSRYGFDWDDASGLVRKRFGQGFLANVYLSGRDLLVTGLGAGVGFFNVLNSDFRFVQPYDGVHPPLPGPSRELVVRVTYERALPF